MLLYVPPRKGAVPHGQAVEQSSLPNTLANACDDRVWDGDKPQDKEQWNSDHRTEVYGLTLCSSHLTARDELSFVPKLILAPRAAGVMNAGWTHGRH